VAIAKSIDVNLRSNTESFEKGMRRGASAVNDFTARSDAIAKTMGEAARSMQIGLITTAEYSRTIAACDGELNALNAGFDGMSGAMSRANVIMRGLETSTERYAREVEELNTLKKLGALSVGQYDKALAGVTAQYHKSIPVAELVKEKTSAIRTAFAAALPTFGAATAGILAASAAMKITSAISNTLRDGLASVVSQFARIDAARKAAASIGIATGELMTLRFALGEAGVSAESTDRALQKMVRTISEAATTGKGATATIENLGLSVGELGNMSAKDAFFAIVDAISRIEGSGARATAAFQLFGRTGMELLPTFTSSADVLRESAEFAERFGFNLSEIDASAIEQANDALGRIGTVMEGISVQISARLGKQVLAFGIGLLDVLERSESKIRVLAKLFDHLGKLISFAAGTAGGMAGIDTNAIRAAQALMGGGISQSASVSDWWSKNLAEADRRLAGTGSLASQISPAEQMRAVQMQLPGSATAMGRGELNQVVGGSKQQIELQKKMEAHLAYLRRQRPVVLGKAPL